MNNGSWNGHGNALSQLLVLRFMSPWQEILFLRVFPCETEYYCAAKIQTENRLNPPFIFALPSMR